VPAFEEAYRVPLILRGPGVPVGLHRGAPVSLLDLGRARWCGCCSATTSAAHGRDLGTPGWRAAPPTGAASADAATGDGEAYAEFHGQRLRYTQRIVWHGRHKYVFNGFDDDELYDLEADPFERTNLAGDPRTRTTLRAMAARMWAEVRATGDRTLGEAQYGMFRFAAGRAGGRRGRGRRGRRAHGAGG
jgi:arylsulfatase A-like enzyme